MFKIAICDDEKIFVELLHNIVLECVRETDVKC